MCQTAGSMAEPPPAGYSPRWPRGPSRSCPTDIDTLDVVDRTAVRAAVDAFRPDIVLHGGAYTAVDACESEPDTAFAVNALGTRNIAEAASGRGPPGVRLDRLCLRRYLRPPLSRMGSTQSRARSTDAASSGERSRCTPWRARRHGGPHGLGERRPRRQHGQDGAAPGQGRPRRPAALRQ